MYAKLVLNMRMDVCGGDGVAVYINVFYVGVELHAYR